MQWKQIDQTIMAPAVAGVDDRPFLARVILGRGAFSSVSHMLPAF